MNDNDYIPPSLRNGIHLTQFIGAVKTRIQSRQKAFWSRIIGAGFIAEDIWCVWPEDNMRFFSMKTGGASGIHRSWNIDDLNLRELDELLQWLTAQYPQWATFDPFDKKTKLPVTQKDKA